MYIERVGALLLAGAEIGMDKINNTTTGRKIRDAASHYYYRLLQLMLLSPLDIMFGIG